MNEYTKMFQYVGTYLNTVEEVQPPPLHCQLGETWWTAVSQEWKTFLGEIEPSEEFSEKANEVLECFQIGYECIQEAALLCHSELPQKETLTILQAKPQSVQRTEEWYKEMRNTLTASEFYQLFTSPRSRGTLVLSKVQQEREYVSPRVCCLTMEMTPLDWGIRFEPIAKQILEKQWSVKIAELGRIHHHTIKGLAASPDGMIVEPETSPLYGNLVEIKCPSSRTIGKGVPKDYWYQMQLQLEVTEMPVCQYTEFHFKSYTAQHQQLDISGAFMEKGVLCIVQNEDLQKVEYRYGPLGDMDWTPSLDQGWELLERVPWGLEKMWIQPVLRDEAWFQSILPLIHEFWQDVEKANQGQFTCPESTVKRKAAVCAIVD
jgi:hypothetical protein